MFNFNVSVPVDAINAWQQQITDRRKRANRRWWSCIRINIAGDKFETFMFHQMLLQAATLRMGLFVIILCSFVSCKNSLYYFDIAVHCDTLFMFPELSFLWENTNKFTLRVARLRKWEGILAGTLIFGPAFFAGISGQYFISLAGALLYIGSPATMTRMKAQSWKSRQTRFGSLWIL